MLSGKHVVFLGGDARQLEIIKKCIDLRANVSLVGFDNLQNPFIEATNRELTPDLMKTVDVLILPIVGTDDRGNVESIFTKKTLVLTEEHIDALPEQAVIYVGMAKPYLRYLCEKHGKRLVELLERDDVAIYNSIPTVEGALMMAIQNTDITVHGSSCIVLGLGRVGMTLARTLHGLGARVRVGVRQSDLFARAYEMGITPFQIEELSDQVEDVDLLFNTIPALVVTSRVIAQMPHRAVIIDLASKPGGVDFKYAEKRGIKALLAPSLPGLVAPKTAGRILAMTIVQDLSEQDGKGGKGER
ncbi:MAG: dipicolinate synthase subunit DpsA [Planifilum fimeticola]|jgi:dipicolinate synthase subunit A